MSSSSTTDPDRATLEAWDDAHVYWQLNEDKAIYRCALPNCASGPTLFASQAMATDLAVASGTLYWLDRSLGISRMPSGPAMTLFGGESHA